MDRPYADLAGLYRFHGRMLARLVSDLSEAEWRHRSAANPALWVLAHLVASKRGLLRALCSGGAAAPAEAWEALAGRGGSPDAELPAAAVLLTAWHDANAELCARLELMGLEEGGRPAPRTMPDGGTTLIAMARFLQFHEAYHLGQLGLLRRLAGKPGAV
jgi:hypothetical protein